MRRRTTTTDRRRIATVFERLEARTVLAAPAASGPATASVIQGSTLAFSGASLVSVTDTDATATESVAVSASAGTVSLNLAAPPAVGRQFYVESAAQFNAGVDRTGASFKTLRTGDRVLLKGGTWGGVVNTITGSMSDAQAQANPAMIIACDANYVPTPGGVIVAGVSAIELAGTGIELCGLTFSSTSGMLKAGNYVDYDDTGATAYLIRTDGGSRYMSLSHVKFDRCGWDSTDYANNDHYGAWILMYGYHHTVQYCEMTGRDFDPNDINVADPTRRRSIRQATVVIYKDDVADLDWGWHKLNHNYFGERKIPKSSDIRLPVAADGRLPADLSNGWETIRCGSSSFVDVDFNVTIENNTFYHSIQAVDGGASDQTGEPEMISIKSRRNVVRNNTILNNYGEVCIRQGDYNVVTGNVFLAGGAYDSAGNIVLTETRNDRMGGVRVFGFGNTVADNYFYKLGSDGIRSALILGSGSTAVGTLSSLTNGSNGAQYETANYTHVIGNTFIDCATISLDNANGEPTPVYGTQFLNNVISYSSNIGANGMVGNDTAGYGSLLLATRGGTASGNHVYSASNSQLGRAKALLGDTWLNDTFEAYSTGATPTSATSPQLVSAGYTTVAAGNGGKMARYLKTTSSNAGSLQYSLSSSNSTARPQGFISFDIQQNANASVASANQFYFRLGVNDTASMSAAASAFVDIRFSQAATDNLKIYSSGTQVGTTTTISPTAVSNVKVWYNNTALATRYVDPSGVDQALNAKSFVVYVGTTLVTPSASGSTMTAPTSGSTSLDVGKIAFLTGSTGQADFSIDNIFAGDANPRGVVNTISTASSANPLLTGTYDVLAVPAANSPLIGKAAGTPTVNDTSSTSTSYDLAGNVTKHAGPDLRGLTRPATGRDIGSYEVEATGTGWRPLRRAEVGVIATAYPTISGVTVTSGASGTSAITITGGLTQVNAVLATLTYTAPATGASATLTVQPNDGTAAGSPLTTAIAVTLPSPTMTPSAAGTTATPVGSVTITFVRPVTGFGIGDLALTRGGSAVSLAGATLGTTDSRTFTLNNLGTATATDGVYVLSLAGASAGIADGSGSQLNQATTSTWTLDTGIVVPAGQTVVDSTVRSGTMGITKRGAGTLVLTEAATFTGSVVVEEGELVVRNVAALGSGRVDVRAGARLSLDVAAGGVALASLALDVLGRFDLGSGSITVAAGGYVEDTLRQRLIAGRNDGAWDGATGIVSRIAATQDSRSVGWAVLYDGSMQIAFAAPGDANIDGTIDILDAANFIAGGTFDTGALASWDGGDFNYDSMVDILDAADFLGSGLFDAGGYLPAGSAQPPAGTAEAASLDTMSLAFAAFADVTSTTSGTRKKLAGSSIPA
jgi:autotransporter-associated beta strand protein